jgi:hypothetical protein
MVMGAFICTANRAESSAMERDQTRIENRGTLADSELEAVAGSFGVGFPTSLAMTTVGASTDATWTPRTYAVQTDLSGSITGARAGSYGWRRP